MKATILAHESVPQTSMVEIHRFKFQLDDGNLPPYDEIISLRTARVIVESLEDGNAFIKMLRAIVAASADQYDDLVGNAYPDHFVADDESIDRPMPGRESQAHRT